MIRPLESSLARDCDTLANPIPIDAFDVIGQLTVFKAVTMYLWYWYVEQWVHGEKIKSTHQDREPDPVTVEQQLQCVVGAFPSARVGGGHLLSGGTSTELLGVEVLGLLGDTSGNGLTLLGKDELDVSREGFVLVDTTVSTVGTTTHLLGLVDLDVGDDEAIGGHILSLGVGFGVFDQVEEDLNGLFRPATEGFGVLLGLAGTTDTVLEADEWDTVVVLKDLLEVVLSLDDIHALDSSSGFAGVLCGEG